MIKLSLSTPVVLTKQLDALDEKLKEDWETLRKLADYESALKVLDNGEFAFVPTYRKDENDVVKDVLENDGTFLFGPEAIQALCDAQNVPFSPLSSIVIPDEVEKECSKHELEDIKYLANLVKYRAERLEKLESVKAPDIIMHCEKRVLREYVDSLEDNCIYEGRSVMRPDDMVRRSLSDIGYSLIDGWDEDMLRQFEENNVEDADEADEKEDE